MPTDALHHTFTTLNLDNEIILLVFVAVAAAALLLQAIVLLAIWISVRKAVRTLRTEVEELRAEVMPIVHSSREFLSHIAPKIEEVVEDLAEVAYGLRMQSAETFEQLHRQSNRVDRMVTGALDAVDRTGNYVVGAVIRPMRQVAGVLAAIKATVESLRSHQKQSR